MKSYHLYKRVITPSEAIEILETRNNGNRKIKRAKVAQYASAMEGGRWKFTPVPLIFEEHTGRLLDGQNRLKAVVVANQAQPFMVCDDAMPDVMVAIDQGASRSPNDHLTTRGIHGGASLAPLLLAIIGYSQDPDGMWSVIKPVSNEEYVEAYEANPLLIEEAEGQGKRCNKEWRLISRTDYSFVYYLLKKAGVEQSVIDDFFHRLSYGTELQEDDPVLQFRKWLANNPDRYAGKRDRRQRSVNNIIKAFLLYREGKTVRSFTPPRSIVTTVINP